MNKAPSGTARRLFAAFAVILAFSVAASWFALASLREVQGGLRQIQDREQAVRAALELASAVRDQYAHQAHTIILGNASHLTFYEEAARRVGHLTQAVKARAAGAEERAWVAEIEAATGELDAIFRKEIVPAVLARDEARIQDQHGLAQLQVTRIQERTDRLVDRFEATIGDIQGQVAGVERAARRWTFLFLGGLPLLAVGLGWAIYRSVARPVARLGEGAARWAAGDLDARVAIDGDDEFGALARQFNAMATAVKEHQARLVQSEKLAGIGRLAAGVAHEINNPLAVILGYARLLGRRHDGPLAADLGKIEAEAVRAQEIVEGLLDLSRPLPAAAERLELADLCRESVERLARGGRLDGVEVTVSGEAAVAGHPQKLGQVLVNLVRNGADAAGPGGRVAVEVRPLEGGGAEVTVADSGPGLPPAVRERLFEPFVTTKPGGTGLGLAVSLGIVQAHGGRLEAAPPGDGGARFTIRLPASPPAEVTA